ncbi:MAG TPA: enoyl-CoA hydratase-related protein, partial [Xanthobacteraceae bacterium]|nr:enoyl-CoA hydratase-related protein [Xanthobacteraceae bacterium]
MSESGVGYAVADKVARITFSRPPVNALSLDMIRAIVAALRSAAADEAARAVVLASGVPGRFCAG